MHSGPAGRLCERRWRLEAAHAHRPRSKRQPDERPKGSYFVPPILRRAQLACRERERHWQKQKQQRCRRNGASEKQQSKVQQANAARGPTKWQQAEAHYYSLPLDLFPSLSCASFSFLLGPLLN